MLQEHAAQIEGDQRVSGSDVDNMCVICGGRTLERRLEHGAPPTAITPGDKETTLRTYKAVHDFVAVSSKDWIRQQMDLRRNAIREVQTSAFACKLMVEKAAADAHAKRVGSVNPLNAQTVWDGPKDAARDDAAAVARCTLFWTRLRHFLEYVRYPETEKVARIVEVLRQHLVRRRAVTQAVLVEWFHLVGPEVLSVREAFRIASFVRILLGIRHDALIAWLRLPEVRKAGFELTLDEA